MGHLRSAFGLLLSLSFALPASAQDAEPTTARLDFQTEVEGCMPATRFGDEVSARVGRVVFADDATNDVRVRVTREESEVVVTVTTNASEEHAQGRSRRFSMRTFRDPSCDEALEAAAASVAVWVDEAPAFGVGGLGAMTGDSVGEPVAVLGMLDDGRVTVRASSNRPGLTFHLETNTGRGQVGARFFERLCVMPCEARIRRGVQQFGIADGNGIAYALPELTEIQQDSELFVDVRRASGWNLAGRYLFVAGFLLVAPIAIPITAVKKDDWGKGMLWASIGISAGLVVGGTLMFSLSDGGGIEVAVRPLQR
ncbi:MAG: hypothetical protein H6721_04285 [Sandaracinus sp.]|nr:hypothetical protein [Sandaracinus sp.]MCB9631343.1 hypothetical protein [Sandaracinus sp.]